VIRRDCLAAVAVYNALEAGELPALEHLEAKYRNAASMGMFFPSYDVNSGFKGDKSQHAP
jgi:hypothetical protein